VSAPREFVIPLVHDAEFFNKLQGNIEVLAARMEKIHSEFLSSLLDLARMITDTCQPASVAGNYHPYSSVSTHPGTVEVKVGRMKVQYYFSPNKFLLMIQYTYFRVTYTPGERFLGFLLNPTSLSTSKTAGRLSGASKKVRKD
jgi:hypothetical protein